MLILVLFFQGVLLFAGFGLGINAFIFDETNQFFLIMLSLVGGILGGLVGLFMQDAGPKQAWAISIGSIAVGVIAMGIAMAFDYFIFGSNNMHWRGVLTVGLISTGPGMFVGWMLAHQVTGTSHPTQIIVNNRLPSQSTNHRSNARPMPNQVAPTYDTTYQPSTYQLQQMIEQEITTLPPNFQNSEVISLDDGSVCLTTQFATSQGWLQLYITCSTNYPHQAPQINLEHSSGGEIQVRQLQSTNQWQTHRTLSKIANEIVYMYS